MTTASWIDEFGEYLESVLNPAIKANLKQDYIQWVKQRENYYAALGTVAPEFLQLLNVIEKHLAVKVEIEDEKGSKKEPKEEPKKQEPKEKDKK